MQQPFVGLYATYYDVLFPLDETELNFYCHWARHAQGPVLEIGCGTGNMLCALARNGFEVHGLDCSKPMLDLAARKAHESGLSLQLHHQALEALALPHTFSMISVSSCSFMFLTDYVQAQQTLTRLYDHMSLGGYLLISSFLPYQEMMSGVSGRQCIHDITLDDQSQLTVYQTVTYDSVHHTRTCVLDFELWCSGTIHQQEQHAFLYRWYGVEELMTMIKAAGFCDVAAYGDYQTLPLAADAETVIVVARKPL